MKKIYIAGKVTGEPIEVCSQKFAEAQQFYEKLGFEVVNPIKLVNDFNTPWKEAMEICLAALIKCDAVVLLNDWEDSKGAKIERQLAEDLDMLIVKRTKLGTMILKNRLKEAQIYDKN